MLNFRIRDKNIITLIGIKFLDMFDVIGYHYFKGLNIYVVKFFYINATFFSLVFAKFFK